MGSMKGTVVNMQIDALFDLVINAVNGISGFTVLSKNRCEHQLTVRVKPTLLSRKRYFTIALAGIPWDREKTVLLFYEGTDRGREIQHGSRSYAYVCTVRERMDSLVKNGLPIQYS